VLAQLYKGIRLGVLRLGLKGDLLTLFWTLKMDIKL
jgi:hypothetical protein